MNHATGLRHIAYTELNKIAAAQLAANGEIKRRLITSALRELQADANRPDLFELQ